MPDDADTQPDDPNWDRPEFCPFCGTTLTDGGPGFVDHLEEVSACRERFDAWRERVADDIGGEWGG